MADTKDSVDNSDSLTCAPTSSTSQEPSSSVVVEPKPEKDLVVEAVQSLQQGKRHMIVLDFKSAVPSFEHACKLLDSCYGTGAIECGEAYLQYGTALFELSRLEEGTTDGLVNVEAQQSSEEDEEEGDNGDDNEDEEEQGNVDEENEAEAKTAPEIVSEEKVDIDLTQPSTSKGETSTSNGDEKSDEDDEADNATNVEIAWEVLGLARDVFSRGEPTKENRLNLAEALQKLGEISLEWENNENAVYMLNECLEHRKEILEPDDRLIAVTYHYLGIAFSFKCDYDNANSCFENALGVIQLRIKNLKEKNIDNLDQFEKDAHEKDIAQLEDLIPELSSKIEDMKEQMQSQLKTLKSLEKEKEEESKQAKLQATQDNKPVNNISHLIKRKKETSENENVAENGSEGNKKARIDVNSTSLSDSNETK